MKKSASITLLYSVLTLTSLLVAMLGYAYTHKPFTPENLLGLLTALWQTFVAMVIVVLAGGIGEFALKMEKYNRLVRIGFDLALGIPTISLSTLVIGSFLGVGLLPLSIFLALAIFLFRKSILRWLSLFADLKPDFQGKYTTVTMLMVVFIFLMHFTQALTPPTMFDTLVYHFTLPKAYLQLGQIHYLPDNMFSGMPQNTEMLYLLAMRFAGAESATVVTFLVGLMAVFGIFGYGTERFGNIAAWTAGATLLAGETLTKSLSSGYVEWTVMLFGWSAIVALDYWVQTRDKKFLILCGIFCGAATGTKYTAGIILLGCLAALAFLPSEMKWGQRLSNILIVGGMAVLVSLPWWLKNFFTTWNPFYPFFFPAGDMNEFRLFHYQNVPTWGDWRSVILVPWQATIWGADSKEGFSASIGAMFVGLSPLAWIGWNSRTVEQKRCIKIAASVILTGFLIWAIGSRFSGLLIQSRLFFGIFPAWGLLAGVGMDSAWKLRALNIRFGRVAGALVLLMLGFNLFATWTEFTAQNPLAYVLRQEDKQGFLGRNMGMYAQAVEAIQTLPASSRVLMLWEARGFACWPKCDADEVIDRWYDDIHTYQEPEIALEAWIEKGYTHLLLYKAGAEFVQNSDPRYKTEDWQKLEMLTAQLPPAKWIGMYALYPLNDP